MFDSSTAIALPKSSIKGASITLWATISVTAGLGIFAKKDRISERTTYLAPCPMPSRVAWTAAGRDAPAGEVHVEYRSLPAPTPVNATCRFPRHDFWALESAVGA